MLTFLLLKEAFVSEYLNEIDINTHVCNLQKDWLDTPVAINILLLMAIWTDLKQVHIICNWIWWWVYQNRISSTIESEMSLDCSCAKQLNLHKKEPYNTHTHTHLLALLCNVGVFSVLQNINSETVRRTSKKKLNFSSL